MSASTWPVPHLSVPSVVVVVLLAVLWCLILPLRAPAGYRRLARDRTAGVPGALERRFRATLLRQALTTAVVLLLVAADGGLTCRSVGLARPTGPHATYWTWYSVVLIGALLASGLALRRRALSGRSVPGQGLFWALVPGTRRERLWGAGLSVGAGVAEELLFRGLFTAALVAAFHGYVGAACVVVTLAFGAAHSYQGWRGVLGTALLGAILSLIYVRTHSLLMPVLVHTVLDLRSLVMVPLARGSASGRRARGVAQRRWLGPERWPAAGDADPGGADPGGAAPRGAAPRGAAPEVRRPTDDRPPTLP